MIALRQTDKLRRFGLEIASADTLYSKGRGNHRLPEFILHQTPEVLDDCLTASG
jgi:hypothetical protein